MPTITLQHCQPVEILTYGIPVDVVLQLTVGGAPGDGVVEITTTPPVFPDHPRLPTGGVSASPLGSVTSVTLHYKRADTSKPISVQVVHTP